MDESRTEPVVVEAVGLTSAGAVAKRSCCVLAAPSDDILFLFGGVGPATCYNDLHMFHVPSKQWTECYPVGPRPSPRGSCAAAVTQKQNWFVFGGRSDQGQFLGDVYSLDLSHLVWSAMTINGQCPAAREDGMMVVGAKSDTLYLIGGCGAAGATADVWRLNVQRMQWDLIQDSAPNYPSGVAAGCCCQNDTCAFIFGGYDQDGTFLPQLESFSLTTETWRSLDVRGSIPRPRSHGLMTMCDGSLVIYGGYGPEGALDDMSYLISVASSPSSKDCFVMVGEPVNMAASVGLCTRRGAAAGAVCQRVWYVFGGCDGSTFLQDVMCIPLDVFAFRSPARRGGSGAPRVDVLEYSTNARHPYNISAVSAAASSVLPSPLAYNDRGLSPNNYHNSNSRLPSVGVSPSMGGHRVHAAFTASGDPLTNSGLMEAICDLKAELFGPRVGHVETLIEENRKLREENARLQQTVIDLMKRLPP